MPQSTVLYFLLHYGYIVLFTALFLEMFAFPIPGEFLMTYSGFLVFQGHLNWYLVILVVGSGTICGITATYWLGSILGYPFFRKYGQIIHLDPNRLRKVAEWFNKYGSGWLTLAYFIPGLRHITGYFSGISRIAFRKFAFSTYLGAFLWAITFVSFGNALGSRWAKYQGAMQRYLIIGSLTLISVLALVYFYRMKKSKLNQVTYQLLDNLLNTFHSLRRVRAFIITTLAVFGGFVIWMIYLIHHYLRNEFNRFNRVTLSVVKLIFINKGIFLIKWFSMVASFPAILILFGLIMVWILIKAKDRILESVFLIIVVWGGIILEKGLRMIFHHWGPVGNTLGKLAFPFPSEKSLVVFAVYGFAAFLLVRQAKNVWVQSLTSVIVVIITILSRLYRVVGGVQYPSDILAGIVFGGVWLSFNILLLEIFRILRLENFKNN